MNNKSTIKYKTCFYNVEELTNKIPDDCIRIVISYLTDKEYFEKLVEDTIIKYWNYIQEHYYTYSSYEVAKFWITTPILENTYFIVLFYHQNKLETLVKQTILSFSEFNFDWTYNENMELISFNYTTNDTCCYNYDSYSVSNEQYHKPIQLKWSIFSNKLLVDSSQKFEKRDIRNNLVMLPSKLVFDLD
jgi:hypothetical protein